MERAQRQPLVWRLMRDYDVDLRDIARDAGVGAQRVEEALDFERFGQCSFLVVARIHSSVEKMLRQHGWTGSSRELWNEFDRCLTGPGILPAKFGPPG